MDKTVSDQFSFSPVERYFLVDVGGDSGFWLLFFSIFILAVITYKLGFAKELPLLKSVIVYIMLFIGCFVLAIFAIFALPIAEVLIVIALVLGIYRFRLYRERKERNYPSNE
uniref:YlaH-like family protein n=1 Tax=uncultured Allobacillus sp. TaxID=1638025 RepID=UPI002595858A|nr:YlaH-like family protein [uncultured Allobacillus sp.]